MPVAVLRPADKNFVFTQGVASSTWMIEHDLGKYPSVTILDSGNTEVIGDVTHIDTNSLIVTFSAAFAGIATLN